MVEAMGAKWAVLKVDSDFLRGQSPDDIADLNVRVDAGTLQSAEILSWFRGLFKEFGDPLEIMAQFTQFAS